MEIKTISIVGLGALGILYGSFFSNALPEGALRIVADPERIARYRRDGIFCNGTRCHFTYLSSEVEGEPADLLIVAVKFGALGDAIRTARRQVGPSTTILSVLNGISSEEYLAEAFGQEKVLLCTAQGMDAVKDGGQMTYHHMGSLSIGTADGRPSDRLEAVRRLFDRTGLAYDVPADMRRKLWGKLMLNTGVNQAVAVFETDYVGVQREGRPREVMIAAMREVIQIAQAEGVSLDESDLNRWVALVDTLAPEGLPSLRQDTLAKRSTEVELFSGTVIRLGIKHQIPTPVNEFLYQRIRELEKSY